MLASSVYHTVTVRVPSMPAGRVYGVDAAYVCHVPPGYVGVRAGRLVLVPSPMMPLEFMPQPYQSLNSGTPRRAALVNMPTLTLVQSVPPMLTVVGWKMYDPPSVPHSP